MCLTKDGRKGSRDRGQQGLLLPMQWLLHGSGFAHTHIVHTHHTVHTPHTYAAIQARASFTLAGTPPLDAAAWAGAGAEGAAWCAEAAAGFFFACCCDARHLWGGTGEVA